MRRTALFLSAAVAATTAVSGALNVLPAPAFAADTTTYSRTGIPDPLTLESYDCVNFASVEPASSRVSATTPTGGRGSLQFGSAGTLSALTLPLTDLPRTSAIELNVATPQGGTVTVHAYTEGDPYYGEAELPSTAAWQSVDLATVPFKWSDVWSEEPGGATTTGTLSEHFAGDRYAGTTVDPLMLGIEAGDCPDRAGGAPSVQVDTVSLTTTASGVSSTKTWDFEPRLTPRLAGLVLPRSTDYKWRYGGNTSIQFTEGGKPRSNQYLELWATPYGSGTATQIYGQFTDGAGRATYDLGPRARTTYEWRFTGTDDYAPVSYRFAVLVRAYVSIRPTASAVRRGSRTSVVGVVLPKRKQAVTVYRKLGDRLIKLGSATTSPDGTYKVTFRPRAKGSWTILTRATASAGYGAGQSVKKSFTVR